MWNTRESCKKKNELLMQKEWDLTLHMHITIVVK